MTEITGFHAHVYFDEKTRDQAVDLCEAARDRFGVDMGRVHERPVGPHPRWSCQLAMTPEQFGDVIAWLALNRNGLTVFTHAETGDHLKDHTDHTIWMGEMLDLELAMFKKQ